MNDFTKEELKRLLLRSYLLVGYPENQNKYELELINKIQSMIDNYCEHDRCSPTEMLNIPYHCLDCGKKFE